MPQYPRWVPGELKLSLVSRRPLETVAELEPISPLSPLVHLVSVLWGGESHAERRETAIFVTPSCPGLPGESVGRPLPCEP
jgi:hypothetical protein